jgi:hypothetical protein
LSNRRRPISYAPRRRPLIPRRQKTRALKKLRAIICSCFRRRTTRPSARFATAPGGSRIRTVTSNA